MLLETLVAQAEAKFPSLAYKKGGTRAEEAAEFVRQQKVTFDGWQGGKDWWTVNGHKCGITHGCDCLDHAAPLDPNGRKLCKHRLAVMFVRKLQQDHGIAAVLRNVKGNRCVLTVQVLYADGGQQNTLSGWRAAGAETTLEYEDRIRFTNDEFSAALRVAGWGMEERPVKLAGLNYRYILKRGAENVYAANVATADQLEQKAQRQRLAEIAALDEASASNEVMQGLPAAVQAAILNHAGLVE